MPFDLTSKPSTPVRLAPESGPSWLASGSTAFALVLMLLGFVAFALTAYANRKSLQEVVLHTAARNSAMETQLLIEQINTLLVDIETGQRGYVITGQPEFLEPYEFALLKLRGVHSLLTVQLSAESGEQAPTSQLDSLIEKRVAQVRENLDRRLAVGIASVKQDLASYVEGKRVMDAIRAELDRLKTEQSARVDRHNQAVSDVQRRTNGLSLALPFIGAILLIAAVGRLLYERRRRDLAEVAMRTMNATLEQQVGQRTAQLQKALAHIKSFASELDRSIEGERRRLARELHDQFGQVATAIRLIVMNLKHNDPPLPDETIKELTDLIDEAIGMARRISAALRPPLLDDLGLAAAVEHFSTTIQRQSGLVMHCHIDDDTVLSAHQANQLFRILQEATTNVLRHARASELRIEALVDSGEYRLEIADNGVGPGSVRPDASGIRNMRERAQLIGAVLHFGAGEQGGTRVAVHMPIESGTKETSHL